MPKPAKDKELFNKVFEVLEKNSEKDFVRRIQDAENSPSLLHESGEPMTHQMNLEVGEALGFTDDRAKKWYVFPSILRDDEGKLVYNRDKFEEAWPAAAAKSEFIEFDSFEEADEFERSWKVVWGHPPRVDD